MYLGSLLQLINCRQYREHNGNRQDQFKQNYIHYLSGGYNLLWLSAKELQKNK